MDALQPHEGASCYGRMTATMHTVLAKPARRAAPVLLVGWACSERATPPLCIELTVHRTIRARVKSSNANHDLGRRGQYIKTRIENANKNPIPAFVFPNNRCPVPGRVDDRRAEKIRCFREVRRGCVRSGGASVFEVEPIGRCQAMISLPAVARKSAGGVGVISEFPPGVAFVEELRNKRIIPPIDNPHSSQNRA